MSAEIVVPALGESVVDATLARWLVKQGDFVNAGDPVVALETDKVDLDISAEESGILQEARRGEGDTVVVGEVLGVIAPAADGAARPVPAAAEPSTPAPEPVAQAEPAEAAGAPEAAEPGEAPSPTPLARTIAQKNDIDLGRVQGSGPSGRITKADVADFIERTAEAPATATALAAQAAELPHAIAPVPEPQHAPAAPPPPVLAPTAAPAAVEPPAPAPEQPSDREERRRMTRRRQTIAARLVEAQHTAAMLTTFNEVDMSAIMSIRKRRKDAFKEQHGVGLGFMSFFTKAVVGALKAFPLLNSEIQGDEIVVKRYYDIGVAVSTDEGLVVPVLRDADRKTFPQIEQDVVDLATRARSNALTLPELRGGTFTITNGGVFGSLLSTPILNSPQVGILGMHKIEDRPIALNGEVVIRPMMYLALSYDHRVVDGAEAVRFLVRIKELLEDPEALLLEG